MPIVRESTAQPHDRFPTVTLKDLWWAKMMAHYGERMSTEDRQAAGTTSRLWYEVSRKQ